MAGGLKRLGVAVALLVGLASSTTAQAAGVADELVREAKIHEVAHEEDIALRRYADALALDPTLGDAYLGLGALRFRLGDAREAERVYDTALSHVPDLIIARLGRGRARRALGDLLGGDLDIATYATATGDAEAWRELASDYADEGRPVAQLAAWRSLLALAETTHSRVLHEARLTVHALEILLGTVDPVRSPPGVASAARRGLARIAKRR
jgi:tetratricopeptide (TPR) repeat protein